MMHRSIRTPVVAIVLAGLLASCGDSVPDRQVEGDARTAEGEILPASVSDEMIKLDRLRSQGQSAESEGGDTGGNGDANPSDAQGEAESGDEPRDEPESADVEAGPVETGGDE